MNEYFIFAFVGGALFTYFVGFIVSQVLAERKIYKVSIFTLGGTLVGCVNVKALDSTSAAKKGYKLISEYSVLHYMTYFPKVEEVGKVDKCI